MDNLTEKHKGKSIDLLKRAFKDYLDKYFTYQELDNRLKFPRNSEDKTDLTMKRESAKAEWKKASENYQKLLSSKNKTIS